MPQPGTRWTSPASIPTLGPQSMTQLGTPCGSCRGRPDTLPFVPNFCTKVSAPKAGILTINGSPLNGGAVDINSEPVFAVVTTNNHAVRMLPVHVFNYVAIGSDEIVYSDVARNIAKLSLV